MEIISTITEILFIGLAFAAIITIIKYPKDLIRAFINFIRPTSFNLVSFLFYPLWLIIKSVDKAFRLNLIEETEGLYEVKSDEPYKATKKLKFDYRIGDKYIMAAIDGLELEKVMREFNGYLGDVEFKDFTLIQNNPAIFKLPDSISFIDFILLVQHVCTELDKIDSYGFFKSLDLSFYCYQDSNTLHNIIGKTNSDDPFSIYTLDDLNDDTHLRVNNSLLVRSMSIKGV
ncbi:hypothetical protein [Fulvivirga lutea]|uniref:Uncharacterized protein n=1 Tax=Fulvivirga lutea TaxID=2810512 RepID=A0A974WFG3_9BACT|nr:hypothetical protein [Fulvivirga lutea]QSE97246.1 hypothetical protein JR347_16895 [Fulvivirga lutea]